ncbi:hypothetical protein [Paenibacillus massiliensis]|uniref:hypothetical protein n=1 Tax=Paenibacillus massiliensis TaxID=225917 RepID=UPI000471C216|nr:hypothetical protein [Paenibacillus massiliensis]
MLALQRIFLRSFMRYMHKSFHQPAPRGQDGELILRRNWLWRAFLLIGLIAFLFLEFAGLPWLTAEMTSAEDQQIMKYLNYLIFYGLALICVQLLLNLTSKTVINESSVTVQRLFQSRTVMFEDITEVAYAQMFGGQLVLSDGTSSLKIPIEMTGIMEAMDLLRRKLPQEQTQKLDAFVDQKMKIYEQVLAA